MNRVRFSRLVLQSSPIANKLVLLLPSRLVAAFVIGCTLSNAAYESGHAIIEDTKAPSWAPFRGSHSTAVQKPYLRPASVEHRRAETLRRSLCTDPPLPISWRRCPVVWPRSTIGPTATGLWRASPFPEAPRSRLWHGPGGRRSDAQPTRVLTAIVRKELLTGATVHAIIVDVATFRPDASEYMGW